MNRSECAAALRNAASLNIGGPLALVDEDGRPVSDADMFTRPTLLYFGYTFCPDVCPLDNARNAEALDILLAQGYDAQMAMITIDPERDTPRVLDEYVRLFDDRIIALRGPKPYTDHMVKAFNARYEFFTPDPEHPEDYSVDHTASVAFVGPDGNVIKRFPHGMSAEDITADIRATMLAATGQ